MKILIFLTKFAQRGYFWSKTEKVNTTIKFYIFELVYIHGRNILELCNILEKFRFTTSKAVVDIYYKKLCMSVAERLKT